MFTQEQLEILYQLVTRSQISGNDAEKIVELKQAIAKALEPVEDDEESAKKRGAVKPK